MKMEAQLNNATRKLFSVTNLAGRLHHRIDAKRLDAQSHSAAALASFETSRWGTVKGQVRAQTARAMSGTAHALAPAFSTVDVFCGRSCDRPFTSLVPTNLDALRQNVGILGLVWGVLGFGPGAIGQQITQAILPVEVAAWYLGAIAGGLTYADTNEGALAIERALELISWPIFRVYGQICALAGFVIKAVPLAIAACVGAMIGVGKGLGAKLEPATVDERRFQAANDCTLRGDALDEIPDRFFVRLGDFACDIRDIAQFNRGRAVWVQPHDVLITPLTENERRHLLLHRSGVGRAMLKEQLSKEAAAARLPAALVDAVAQAGEALNQINDPSKKEAALARLVEARAALDRSAQQDFERVMVSKTGETLDQILRNLNPPENSGRSPDWFFGCANDIAAYFRERAAYMVQSRAQMAAPA